MNMVKQAQQMKKRMAEMQAEIAKLEMEGEAGGGLVKVRVTGENKLTGVQLDPKAAEDLETLEDLILVAANNALEKVQTHVSGEMKKLTGGMNLPF